MRKIWNKGHRIRASDKHLVYHFSIGTLLFIFREYHAPSRSEIEAYRWRDIPGSYGGSSGAQDFDFHEKPCPLLA